METKYIGRTKEGHGILCRRSAYTLPYKPAPGSCVLAWEMAYCKKRGLSIELLRGGQHR